MEFLMFAGLMFVTLIIFILMSLSYEYVKQDSDQGSDDDSEADFKDEDKLPELKSKPTNFAANNEAFDGSESNDTRL